MTTSAPERFSPRLARKEQKKLMRETVMLIVGAVVVGIVFILFILPWFFSLFLKLVGGSESSSNNDLPPQTPVLSAPVDATSSAQLAISGYTESKATVTLVINSEETDTTTAADDGTFEFDLRLKEGENSIQTFATRDELKSASSQTYTVILDTKKPKLEISKPEDGQTVDGRANQLFTITGTTDPEAHVLVNGRTVYPDSKGEFTTTIQLQNGENKIEFTAIDKANNETKAERKVTFKE